jgi:hypothetical protein
MSEVLNEEYFKGINISKKQLIFLRLLLSQDTEFKGGEVVQCNFYNEDGGIYVNGLYAGKPYNKCFKGYIYDLAYEYHIELNVEVLKPGLEKYSSYSQVITDNYMLEEVNYHKVHLKNLKRVKNE